MYFCTNDVSNCKSKMNWLLFAKKRLYEALFHRFFHSNCHRDGSADHRVVAHADEAHHFNVSRNGRAARELRVAVHTAHRVGHAVRSRACRHVVGMQRSARAAARSNGEVFLAVLDGPFLICACNRVLEPRRVRGVTGNGNVNAFMAHDRNALVYVIRAVAAYFRAVAVRVFRFRNDLQLARRVIIFRFNVRKAVDTGDDLRRVLAKAV